MKNLLFVFFIFAGMITFFTQAMVFASEVTPWVFWGAVALFVAAMVVIGCWDYSETAANRFGWLFMILIAAFCILTNLSKLGELSGLLTVAFFGLYGAVGALNFIREGGNDAHAAH